MEYSQEEVLTKISVKTVLYFFALSSIATILPFLIHLQWLTGPIVNAVLILVLFFVGITGAVVVAVIPSMMALAGGLLPIFLAPLIPFIVAGNLTLILCVAYFKDKGNKLISGYWQGVFWGAFLKFVFLYASILFLGKFVFSFSALVKAGQMMGLVQFITAFLGGMIAWVILKWLKRI